MFVYERSEIDKEFRRLEYLFLDAFDRLQTYISK
jgi:hypothetical protein